MAGKPKALVPAVEPPHPATVEGPPVPHDLSAERAVLGGILVDNRRIDDAVMAMRPSDMFRAAHRVTFEAMLALETRGVAIDAITLSEELRKRGQLDDVGGVVFLSDLASGMARSVNVAHYAHQVHEKAVARGIIQVARHAAGAAYEDTEPVEAQLTRMDVALLDLRSGIIGGEMAALSAETPALEADISFRIAHRGQVTGVPSGLASLDELTGGWEPGDMIVMAARPSIGKTAYALRFARTAAETTGPVAIFSYEMTKKQMMYRLLAQMADVNLTRLTRGWVQGEELDRVTRSFEALKGLPFHLDDSSRRSTTDIRVMCRRLRATTGLSMIVVDYIGLMAGELPGRDPNRTSQITDLSRKLKRIAVELGVPILVLSQLNRGSTMRADPKPKMSDLRESGALEQDADVVLLLHRKNHKESGTTLVIVDKARNSDTGEVKTTFTRETQTVTDGGDDPPAPTDEEQAEAKRAAKRAYGRRR